MEKLGQDMYAKRDGWSGFKDIYAKRDCLIILRLYPANYLRENISMPLVFGEQSTKKAPLTFGIVSSWEGSSLKKVLDGVGGMV